MPAPRFLESRRRHAVEIAATGNGCGHGERVADLRGFRFHLGRERKISDRAGKGGWCVRRERLDLDRGRLAGEFNLLLFGTISKVLVPLIPISSSALKFEPGG